jgi:AraC-like DNA-binding protein
VLDAPQATHDPRLLATVETLAKGELDRRGPRADGFRALVERRVRAALEHGEPSIRTIALGLKMSTRTLQRRLETEGVGYAEVLDQVREQLARTLVAAKEPSLSEIAFQLGFAEFATFSRAFKRWTGSPPGAFRDGHS